MDSPMDELMAEAGELVSRAVATRGADGLLFSGGVDSTILAALLARTGRPVKAVTVTLEGQGEDLGYAVEAASSLGLDHYHLPVTAKDAIHVIPEVIKAVESFDPALPNDIVVYLGLTRLKALGARTVMTGDGADELFAGYEFMAEMDRDEAEKFIRRIAPRMSFSSNAIARALGLGIVQPFIDPEVISFALRVPMSLKIRGQGGVTYGKWILRKTFEHLFPQGAAWQTKRPLEYGSAMTMLRETVTSMVGDEEYENHPYPVAFMNKEHCYYYRVYRDVAGPIPQPLPGERPCPGCGAGMMPDGFHCRICGNVLDWRNG